jgi:hypothetical protein
MTSPRRARRTVSRLLALSTLAAGPVVAVPAAAAAATADPGAGHTSWATYAPIGYDAAPGSETYSVADAQLDATGDAQAVTVEVRQGGGLVAGARFDAGTGAQLTAGVQTPAAAGMLGARACAGAEGGSFTVEEVEFAEGQLTRFAATWRHTCSTSERAVELRGSVAWQASAAAAPVPGVVGADPEPVLDLEVEPWFQGFGLEWTNPKTPDWKRTVVRAAVGTRNPQTPAEGFAFYSGRRADASTNIARPGTSYAISIFTEDTEGRFSAPVFATLKGVHATLTASRARIDWWTDVALSGRLTDAAGPVGDRAVDVMARRPGRLDWYYVGTADVASDGRWTLPISPGATYDYWVFYRPEYSGDRTHGDAVAGPVRVTLAHGVDVGVEKTRGRLGTTFEIGTVVGPSVAGTSVHLQRLVDGKWRTVQTKSLYASRPTWFTVKPTKRGEFRYRVYKPATAAIAAGTSRTVKITTW